MPPSFLSPLLAAVASAPYRDPDQPLATRLSNRRNPPSMSSTIITTLSIDLTTGRGIIVCTPPGEFRGCTVTECSSH